MHGVSSRRKGCPVAAGSVTRATIQPLEPRQLMSAVYPTAAEQYLLELVNRARANPAAEAARFGVALNEGLPAGTISTAARQPLAFNPNLGDAARKHTNWMFATDTFTHNEGSVTPVSRMRAAGYPFSGSWIAGENIWWWGYTAPRT